MAFSGNIYAPPDVYTQTNFESPTGGVIAGVRIPVIVGTGNEILTQSNLEVIRGSSSQVDQFVPQEDMTGRSVVQVLTTGEVVLGDFNGSRRKIQVRNFPIVQGDGSGTVASDTSVVLVTINGRPDVVLSVSQASQGIIELSTAPQLGDDVRVSYYFNRTDTRTTDNVSSQVTSSAAIIEGLKGAPVGGFLFAQETRSLQVRVDGALLTIDLGLGAKNAATVVSLINGAAVGTSLVASTFTNNFAQTAIRLTAAQELEILAGGANNVLGFTTGDKTIRNKVFFVYNGPIVTGDNGGVTTTDPSRVTVKVNNVQVIPTAVDGQTRAVTLPFAPAAGSTVTIQYYFNTWQDTFDYLANIGITQVLSCGIVPNNRDYVQGADFILKDDKILWGTSFLISAGENTSGSPLFNEVQVSGLLIDNRWFLSPTSSVTDTSVNPPVTSRVQFSLPVQPTTGDGRNNPLGLSEFEKVSNGRRDLPTNNPNLVLAYWGFGVQDAIDRGPVPVLKVEGNVITLKNPVPVGAEVFATFYYNVLVDNEYSLVVDNPGPSGLGTYRILDKDGNAIYTPVFGSKGPALTGITINFPSGSELTPDVRFEGGATGPVEETVTVTFAEQDATLAKFSVPGAGPYFFIENASDRARVTVDSATLVGGAAGIDLSAVNGISGLGFAASILGEEISYTISSGQTTYDILPGVNDQLAITVDDVVINVEVPAQNGVNADAYVEAINAHAKLEEFAPVYESTTSFLAPVVISAGAYDSVYFNYTGVTSGPTGPVAVSLPAGTYNSPSQLAAAVDSAFDTAIAALPAIYDGFDVKVNVNAEGKLTFKLLGADADLGTFASGTITSNSSVLGDTFEIDGVTFTGTLTQTSGGLNYNTGQARATLVPTGVQPGDTFTIDVGGGPIVITAAGAQTSGGFNFDEGDQATGSFVVAGPIPGDTVTIGSVTLTAAGAETGALDFDEGVRASGSVQLVGALYGDTFTMDASPFGGGLVTLTAGPTRTPGGLNFNAGTKASGTVTFNGVRIGDILTINGNPLTAVGNGAPVLADQFYAGDQATASVTLIANALPSTGLLYGDTVTIGGVTLTAANTIVSGGLNFDIGLQATTSVTIALSPSTATLTIDGLPLAPAGGPRTSGGNDYDNTLGTTALIAADVVAAINDPANAFAGRMTAALGPGPNDVTLTWIVPGSFANGVVVSSSDATITVAGNFAGGVGDENLSAASLAVAVNDALNGIAGTVSALAAANVVNLTAVTPGLAGNSILLTSSDLVRLATVAFAGGAGDNPTAASNANAAINLITNSFAVDVASSVVGNVVTLTAVVPGSVGNSITLNAGLAAGRFVLSGATLVGGVGNDISAASSLVQAIQDPLNGLSQYFVVDNAGGTSNTISILAFTPGVAGNSVTLVDNTGSVRIIPSAGTLLGGVGTNATVAASLAAAINNPLNGLTTLVSALAVGTTVNITAVTPGNAGNTIVLASSNALRLVRSGATLTGGVGTNLSVANSIVAAINDIANGLAVAVTASNESGTSTTVTVYANVPGVAGNAFTIASSTGVRLPVSGANFVGGLTNIQVASTMVAAITDALNGLNGVVSADNLSGTSAIVTVTAEVPGPLGNSIMLASSNGTRLPLSGATLTGGVGLGGGYLEFIDAPVASEDFAILAGISTDELPGESQTKIINGDIARRFTVAGASGRLIYDRILLRNRIIPGDSSVFGGSQVGQTNLIVQGNNAITETGLLPQASGLAGIQATVSPATLVGNVGFADGQVPNGTYGDARDGQPAVIFFAEGGTNPANNVFKFNVDGRPVTVVFRDAAGVVIPSGGSASVPLGPVGVANTVLNQIQAAAVAQGLPSSIVRQEGAGIRLVSSLTNTDSSVAIGNASANDRLGFSNNALVSRVSVQPEVAASALMSHANAAISDLYLDFQNPDSGYFAAQALAGVIRDDVGAEYLYLQSQANNIIGLGPSSNITLENATTNSWLLPGTKLDATPFSGASGEAGISGFYVTSSDPVNGSGSANTSVLNSGVGQDGVIGQTYRDAVTGLVFTILPRSGGGNYPTGPGAEFTFEVRELVTTNANLPVNSIPGLELLVANTTGIASGDTAIVETFERGGNEPAVGDSYFVTYNYAKSEADFQTRVFSQQRVVERNYGATTPENPVSLAAFLTFSNGAVLVGIKQVPKDPGSNQASVASYLDAFDSLTGFLPGGASLDTITPLRGDSLTLFQRLSNHVDIQSSIRYRQERTAIIGVSSGTQPTEVGDIAEAIKNTRMRLIYPDIALLTITDALGNDKQFLVDGTYLAAAVAGTRASPTRDVATPWTRTPIVGFDSLGRTLDAVQQNQVAVRGVTVIEERGRSMRIMQGLTTDNSNVLTRTPTTITIADEVQRAARRDLDRFIGIKFLPGVLPEIEGQLTFTLKQLKNSEIIAAYTGVQARTTNDPTTVEVLGYYQPVFPLLYIIITFNLRSNLGAG
jgi:hypothetical protein